MLYSALLSLHITGVPSLFSSAPPLCCKVHLQKGPCCLPVPLEPSLSSLAHLLRCLPPLGATEIIHGCWTTSKLCLCFESPFTQAQRYITSCVAACLTDKASLLSSYAQQLPLLCSTPSSSILLAVLVVAVEAQSSSAARRQLPPPLPGDRVAYVHTFLS